MTTQPNLTPELLVPKIGDYLVVKGVLTANQLAEALRMQNEFRSRGRVVLVGDLLIELGLINRSTLDAAITEQILQLRNALQEANRTLEQRVIQRTIELQEALNKLAEMDKLKSNIIANISHELRTPLTHIKGYQELLLAGAMGELNPDQESTLKTIRRSTDRLERLIEDLINFSQISRGDVALKKSRVDLQRLIKNVLVHTQLKADEKQIKLESKIGPDIEHVEADEEKISWVVLQLLDNAVKFTPNQGKVIVEVVNKSPGVLISVEDTGIGIPPEKTNEIFEPFHQLDGSSTRRYGGTGLGLSLVKQIIQAHHTSITVSSTPGVGTRFEFILPMYPPQSTG